MKKWIIRLALSISISVTAPISLGLDVALPAPAGNWTAPADVVPGTVATQPATTAPAAAAMAADPYRMRILNTTAPFSGSREVIVPRPPSKYMLTMGAFGAGYELWDLKTGAKERESATKLDSSNFAISPDGQYLGSYQRGARGLRGAAGTPAGIQLLSLRTGKLVSTIPVPAEASFGAEILGFSGNELVLITYRSVQETRIEIYEIASAKKVGEIPARRSVNANQIAFSPSGKYVALAEGGTLSFYRAATGELLGEISFKSKSSDPFAPDYVNWDFAEPRMAFSPTGREVAIVQTDRSKLRAVIINAESGEILEDKQSAATVALEKNAALAWNPDGSSLLWGTAVIDRGTLMAVYQLPKREDLLYARWADPGNVFMVSRASAETGRGALPGPGARGPRGGSSLGGVRLAFETVAVSRQQLANAIGTLASGGKVEDTGLTPLTPVDLALAREMRLDGAAISPWKAAPADAPRPAKPIVAAFPLKPPGANDASNDTPTALLFTGRDTNAIFIEHVAESKEFGARGQRAKVWLERRDLSSAAASASVELAGTYRSLDASDSGKTVALRSGKEGDRIDVFTADKNTFKPLAAFRPFGIAKPAFSEISGNNDPNIVEWASLLDDAHLLVRSQGGTLAMLELPMGRPVWKMTAADAGFGRAQRSELALSPDRHLAALPVKDGLCLFDPRTGEPLNRLPAAEDAGQASGMGFSPDGTRLAALISYSSQNYIDVYDLKTGQASSHFPINAPPSIDRIIWLSPGYLLLGHPPFPGAVVSLEHKVIVCQYTWTALQYGSVLPFERFFIGAAADSRGPASVAALALPAAEVTQAAAAIKDADLYIWHPGMSVKLDVTVTGDDAYRTQQLALWATALKNRGITVDDKSPNTLRASSFLMDGQATTYKMNNGESVTLAPKLVGYTVTLTLGGAGGDKEIWKADFSKPPEHSFATPIITVQIKQGESAQQAAERQNPQPKTASAIVPPPMYLFKDRETPIVRLSARPNENPRPGPDRSRAGPGRTGRGN